VHAPWIQTVAIFYVDGCHNASSHPSHTQSELKKTRPGPLSPEPGYRGCVLLLLRYGEAYSVGDYTPQAQVSHSDGPDTRPLQVARHDPRLEPTGYVMHRIGLRVPTLSCQIFFEPPPSAVSVFEAGTGALLGNIMTRTVRTITVTSVQASLWRR